MGGSQNWFLWVEGELLPFITPVIQLTWLSTAVGSTGCESLPAYRHLEFQGHAWLEPLFCSVRMEGYITQRGFRNLALRACIAVFMHQARLACWHCNRCPLSCRGMGYSDHLHPQMSSLSSSQVRIAAAESAIGVNALSVGIPVGVWLGLFSWPTVSSTAIRVLFLLSANAESAAILQHRACGNTQQTNRIDRDQAIILLATCQLQPAGPPQK